MELFSKCLDVLKVSETDTEKFAALLLLTKAFKSESLNSDLKKELYDALGPDFLHRMLHTDFLSDGSSSQVFQALALSVLSLLCSDSDHEIVGVIVREISIIKSVLLSCRMAQSIESEAIVDDTLFCISVATSIETYQKSLLENQLIDSLVCLYLENAYGSKKALQVIVFLMTEQPRDSWKNSNEALYQLLTKLSSFFHLDATNEKLEVLNILVSIISTHPICVEEAKEDNWIVSLRSGVFHVMASKLFSSYVYRDGVLKLCNTLTEKFGVSWLGLSADKEVAKDSRKFVAFLIRLVTIEIQLVLEEDSVERVSESIPILLSCYGLLESIISSVTSNHMWEVIQEYTKQLIDAITEAANAIIGFLSRVSTNWEFVCSIPLGKELTFASIRVLCAWLCEETFALRPEVCKVLPFLISRAKDSCRIEDLNDDHQLFKFLLPPLCHLSADNLTRKVLMAEDMPSYLVEYITTEWRKIDDEGIENLDKSLTTVSGVLLNLVVMEGSGLTADESFFDLFRFLHSALPTLTSQQLVLQANFSVLGLLIARHHTKRLKSCESSFYKLLSASTKFLWNAYEIVYDGNHAALILTMDYRSAWSDIQELWFLTLQALSSLLSLVPWIGQYLLTSGWPQQIVSSLLKVGKDDIDGNVKLAYQNFLCCLVKMCPDDIKPLREKDILGVATKHNLKELENLLHAVDISSCQSVS